MKFTLYRDNLLVEIASLFKGLGRTSLSALDFGCGDGFFCKNLMGKGVFENIVPVDVVKRKLIEINPVIYDGAILPFESGRFDVVYAVDVLHHCSSPEEAIKEICRCSGRWVLIKDHCYSGILGWFTLYVMDEMGNRRFKIPSPGNYQKNWSWDAYFERGGFKLRSRLNPVECHQGLLGRLTNRYQYIDIWERAS